jgi:hypothetical protein
LKTTRLKYALLGSGAALAVIAASLPASAGDIDEMRSQIQALQDKIAKIEANEQRRVAPAAAVEAGSKPKSWKLPGTNTSMNIGGFAILHFDYDLNGISSYGPANARVDNTTGARRQGNFDLSARQSRFFISTSTPTDWGDLETLIEIDANGQGGTAGSLEYSSGQGASMRLRKAYGKLGPVLAGQETTTFFVPGAGERTDVATPFLGGSAFRLGMVRYDHSFGGGTMLRVGIEDNIGINETAANAGVLSLNGASQPAGPSGLGIGQALDETPAFVGQLSHAWSSGSAGVSFMVRKVTVDNGGATGGTSTGGAFDDSALSWGVGYGAGWIISKQFRVGAQGIYGKSMGMYSGGSPVLVTASGVASNTFEIDPVTTFGGAAFVQWRFTDTMRMNILYGREEYGYDGQKADLTAASPVASGNPVDYTQQFAANIMWEPVPAVNIGLQYLYTIASINNSPNAKQSRLELAFRYSF